MYSRRLLYTGHIVKRFYCDANKAKPKKHTVAVVGAAGGIGQPLSLLLKLNPSIGELRLHDLAPYTPGVAMDLSHIETACKVTHSTDKNLCETFKGGVDIIVVPAGVPRKPGQKREDLLKVNAPIAYSVAKAMADFSPGAILLLITNPVNSLVPLVCEVLRHSGKLCPGKVIGVSTLDSVRAATFIAQMTGADPKDVTVPIVGGHSTNTIIPLISRTNPKACIEDDKLCQLIKQVQEAGSEVVKAKGGHGSATLATAYAASRLVFAILRALNGESNIVESGYVISDVHPEVKYLATPLILGKNGIEKNLGLGKMSDHEQKLFCEAIGQLKQDIELGEKAAVEQICSAKAAKKPEKTEKKTHKTEKKHDKPEKKTDTDEKKEEKCEKKPEKGGKKPDKK